MPEFKGYPKTPRLFREIVVTEKIDGTNAAIQIEVGTPDDPQEGYTWGGEVDGVFYKIAAQSRKRIITPADDNFGFARWVYDNGEALAALLGVGIHFGEWWGSGIQSGYGLTKGEKRFSLFNTSRWDDVDLASVPGLGVVPVLYQGPFEQEVIDYCVHGLREEGSLASPGFKPAEGVVVFHTAANSVFKVLCENDEIPKGAVA